MKISADNKKVLLSEFDFAILKMEESTDPEEMMYYFSALPNTANRVLNIEFSDDLLFVYFILDRCYKDILDRIRLLKSGHGIIQFNEKFGVKLIEYIKELRAAFGNSNKRNAILKKIVTLSYSSTGNGFYLTQKGMIDIFQSETETPAG